MSFVSGSETNCSFRNPLTQPGVGSGFSEINPTDNDVKVMSQQLVDQILANNRACEKAPKCKKSGDTPVKTSNN